MPIYEELKEQPRRFLSLTSLTPEEFEDLLAAFERAYLKKYPVSKTMTGKKRKRKVGAGRKGSLDSMEQKLLFALVYQKGYPLQSIMGELFRISQGRANEWIHRLLPILKQALDDLGVLPERDPKKFKAKEENRKDAMASIIDGTERRRQRPKQAEKQALHYSRKKKMHSDKNVIIATAKRKRSLISVKLILAKHTTRRLPTPRKFLTQSILHYTKTQAFKAMSLKYENYINRKKASQTGIDY